MGKFCTAPGRIAALAQVVCLGCIVSGCSGGASGPPVVSAGAPFAPGPSQASALPPSPGSGAGIWWGNVGADGRTDFTVGCVIGDPDNLVDPGSLIDSGYLIESGNMTCLLFDPVLPHVVGGMYGALGKAVTGTFTGLGRAFAAPGNRLADGVSVAADFDIVDGQLSDSHRRLGLTITSLGNTQTWSLGFDHYYYFTDAANAEWVTGTYTTFAIFDEPASLAVDESGSLFIQSTSGCVGSGQMNQLRPRFNAFEVGVTIDGCGELNGAYHGLASLIDYQWVNGYDELMLALFNEDGFIAGFGRK